MLRRYTCVTICCSAATLAGFSARSLLSADQKHYTQNSIAVLRRLRLSQEDLEVARPHLCALSSLAMHQPSCMRSSFYRRTSAPPRAVAPSEATHSAGSSSSSQSSGETSWVDLVYVQEWTDPEAYAESFVKSSEYKTTMHNARKEGFDLTPEVLAPEKQWQGTRSGEAGVKEKNNGKEN
eukprot:GHVS01074363.1.p1 GENE.GHVS01074363.1~~GHVS01074363.1.p1  ORF type:complete len:180 (+),score=25.19 GHVS01074363.1:167-706(+)